MFLHGSRKEEVHMVVKANEMTVYMLNLGEYVFLFFFLQIQNQNWKKLPEPIVVSS